MPPTKRTAGRRPAPAASLLADAKKPSRIIDAASDAPSPAPEVIVGAPPVAQVDIEEHRRLQREYRDWLAKMATETPAQAVEEEQDEVVALPSPAERAERAHQEALGYYLACVAEMPADEPRYYVGPRPPRPRFGELTLAVGDLIPGAASWPRIDSWLRAGVVVPEDAVRRVS